MKKSQEIIGLPVFAIVDGRKIGQVKDLVINPEEGKVDYILVSNGSWYVGARILPYKAVLGVGEHAVTTESENQLTNINETADANSLLQRNIEVIGNRVLTDKGNLIGVVKEFEIEEASGKLTRLEYKLADDEGKTAIIDAEDVLTYGADVLVVREKEATNNEPEVIPAAPLKSYTAEEEKDGSVKAESSEQSGESSALFKERQKQYLLGKQVIQDIKDSDGIVLIPEGTVVSEEVFALAEQKGKFMELSQCVR
ncbi:MAG TPA: photosystem reaction center subunit H [Syntrophomonadaceae bacterium]|nr:photosystem reaction center subunit H [Syntrophomonadaceae bacterium]